MLSLVLVACSNFSGPEFGYGGVRLDRTGGDTSGDDTSETGDETDTPTTHEPILDDTIQADWYLDSSAETYRIRCSVGYDDFPDDMDEGTLYPSLRTNGTLVGEPTLRVVSETTFADFDTEGFIHGGDLYWFFTPDDDTLDYDLELVVKDGAGNLSQNTAYGSLVGRE